MFSYLLMQMYNKKKITRQQGVGKKGDLRDFKQGVVVCARWAGLSISQTVVN